MLCRTAYASPGKKLFKESILRICDQRKDNVAEQVRYRVEGALSDLHAADACCHVDCMTNFMSPNSIGAAQNASKVNVNEDPVLQKKWLKTNHACGTQFSFTICTSFLEEKFFLKEHCSYRLKNISRTKLQSFPLLDWQAW